MITVPVSLGERSYDVIVGNGARQALGSLIPESARRAAIVTQASIPVEIESGLEPLQIEHRRFVVPDGEAAKTLANVEQLCNAFAEWGMTRGDVVIAVGGGVVTDLGGFAASVYHRGIAVVHVSTTLLGQIDAAIGGKTGVNLPHGKNLVGAFWQPAGVVCDTELLESLPPRELRSGLGELAKYHFLGGGDLDSLPLDQRVARCVEIKAAVVGADERESGRRATLNYGHTLGHAIEMAAEFDLRHGEAVAIGLVYAAELAHRLGRIDSARVAEHRRVVSAYDLPSTMPAGLGDDRLMHLLARDKKAINGLTFALDGPNGVDIVSDLDPELVRATIAAVR